MDKVIATGRRKSSVARIHLAKGKGKITVNKKDYKEYLKTSHIFATVEEPFKVLDLEGKFAVSVNVRGGGFKGQAEAIRMGISRALCKMDENYKPLLKKAKLLTRDSRVVERKKPGLRKARKSSQFSKR